MVQQRNRPGTKHQDFYNWPLQTIDEMESSFAVQQYIQMTIKNNAADIETITKLPLNQDEDVWQYEQLRMVCMQLNQLVFLLQSVCVAQTCPEMKASEWLYLCAAHSTPQNCSAIDYIVHTLDGATSLLNSNKYFKSRLSIPQTSLKHFQSIARRLYRIFAHAWFHHRQIFDSFEAETHLYERFVRLSVNYKLIPGKLMIIPGFGAPISEGDDASNDD